MYNKFSKLSVKSPDTEVGKYEEGHSLTGAWLCLIGCTYPLH